MFNEERLIGEAEGNGERVTVRGSWGKVRG